MKLSVILKSGINSDGFCTMVMNDAEEVIAADDWSYGFNCSWSKKSASEKEPYVSDVLQNLIDQYQVDTFEVQSGKNVYTGRNVSSDRMEEFKKDYCMNLSVGKDAVQSFEDGLASIGLPDDGVAK